jgi:uncharacterized SAM-binding protein YcdF (DUF218 family)
MKRAVRWGVRALGLSLVALVVLAWLAPGWVLPPVSRYLDVTEEPHAADYVLVLNGDPESRPFAAAALVKVGLAREVLLTRQRLALESEASREGTVLTELELTQRVLLVRGVPAGAVRVLPGEIASTFDEAEVVGKFLADRPEATVLVVTNTFHTRRARWAFRRVLGERAEQVRFVGVPRDGVDDEAWWSTGHGCVLCLSEYPKFLYYRLRYAFAK